MSFLPIPPQATAAIIVAVALSSFGAGWKVNGWRRDAAEAQQTESRMREDAKAREAAQDLGHENQQRADAASTKGESDFDKIKTQFQVVTQTVDRIVEKPVYRNVCFDDDGLRALRSAIDATTSSGAAGSGESSGSMPGSLGSK